MQRRTYLKTVLSAGAAAPFALAQEKERFILLHVDLTVDPAKEKDFVRIFHTTFKPTAAKQKGYRDVRILKLRDALAGRAPGDANYRFVLAYDSEELRQKWVNSDEHKRVWPQLENLLRHKNYSVLLFDAA
jgi:heme-degrading monooxygenase HmoA